MSYFQDFQEHIKSCDFCSKKYASENENRIKPTVRIKAASSYYKDKKLSGLAAIIKGLSYPEISYVDVRKTNPTKSKGASSISNVEKSQKLKELGKLIRGR